VAQGDVGLKVSPAFLKDDQDESCPGLSVPNLLLLEAGGGQERRPKEADDTILPSGLAEFVRIRRVNVDNSPPNAL